MLIFNMNVYGFPQRKDWFAAITFLWKFLGGVLHFLCEDPILDVVTGYDSNARILPSRRSTLAR